MSYWRFFAMIITSTVVMFGLMYLNTYAIDHVFFSETRSYMALYMGAVMAVIMLAFMLGMYSNRGVNIAIFAGSALVFAVSLFLVRSQSTVDDTAWMRAMIPHHSIAILTSERANISDPRVRKLADDIIEAQRLEIDEMKALGTEMLILTGGEPLLRKDIYDIAGAASAQGIWVVMGTNGVLITEKVVEKMIECGVQGVAISIDSLEPAKHDHFRGGPDAWKHSVRALDLCRANGLQALVQTTVMDMN